ncbi:MAG: hypothetical protein LBJ72_13380 [Dysgonamonadaceae bacterium]|jgi:hypothetical protein|nr:hypothetical protein [Dysgonamonadaceae bacterium]
MRTKLFLPVILFLFAFVLQLRANESEVTESSILPLAQQVFGSLDASGNYTDNLGSSDLNVLPIGVKQNIGNNEFAVAISSVVFGLTHAEITIFARLRIPQGNKTLFFAAQGIGLSYGGNIVGDASLVLLEDVDIPFGGNAKFTLKGGFDQETGRGVNLTSVSIDCNGFKELMVTGEFEISKSLATTVGADGVSTGNSVKTTIQTKISDWNDFMLAVTLPPFQITGLNGFIFNIQEATFDFSDLYNAPGSSIESGDPLWRGVYAKNLTVTMPKEFSKGNEKTSFTAQDLLIGSNGITGDFFARNLLSKNEGNASGWAFSLDLFRLKIEENRITEALVEGKVELPVCESAELKYTGYIDADNNYLIRVENTDSLYFDPFFGRAVLAPNSYVQLLVDDGKFKPEAMLHGYMDIKTTISTTDSPSQTADFKRIEFRGFHIMTYSPYIKITYFGYDGEIDLLKFPVSISRIALETKGEEASLGFNINLNLDERYLSGSVRLEILSRYQGGKWRFNTVKLSEIAIEGDIAGVMSVKGSLQIMDSHPVYGDGFSGSLTMDFKKVMPQASVEMNAAFGKKDNYRYWFADGLVGFPGVGIPLVPPINISGFGGGMSYNMKRTINGGLGSSKTGCGYIPDESSGIGLKAAVKFNMAKDNVMNGDLSLEITFNDHGGVNFVGLIGYAKFLEAPSFIQKLENLYKTYVDYEADSGKSAEELARVKAYDPETAAKTLTPALQSISGAAFAACLAIQYDFENSTLDANFETYLNVGGVIRGSGSGNSMGRTALHISPGNWYLLIGTPESPVGIKIGIPHLSTVSTESYFMMGNDLPGSPPPPPEVAFILGSEISDLDYMRNLNELSAGRGFAFGSKLSFDTGDMTCLALYARFMAGVGGDVMLRDYGDLKCAGSNNNIGINGWYANGQLYAYLYGELGVKVNLKIIKGRFAIIQGGAAVLLQAQLPNPSWFGGNMGIRFSILGGLVKGNMRFKFTLGEKCDFVIEGGSPLDYTIISDLTPRNGAGDVDVFTSPQLALSMPVNKSFIVDDEDGTEKEYCINIDEFTLWRGSSRIVGKVEYNKDGDVATFVSHDILPPNEKLKLEVKVGFKEYKGGRWVDHSGQEIRTIEFKTGSAPTSIAMTNISYSYPVIEQRYFYSNESSQGYVQLEKGQPYLFEGNWDYECRYIKDGNIQKTVRYSYNPSSKRLSFEIPQISNSRGYGYGIQFVAVPKGSGGGSIDHSEKTEISMYDDGESSVTQTVAVAKDVVSSGDERDLLAFGFTFSKHGSFADKLSKLRIGNMKSREASSSVYSLGRAVSNFEGFDDAELFGTKYSGNPLVNATATLDDYYFQSIINPLIYAEYPINGFIRLDSEEYGIPPYKGIGIYHQTDMFPYTYDLEVIYYDHYRKLSYDVIYNKIISHPLYNSRYFPLMHKGDYRVVLQYVFPDGSLGTGGEFIYEK